MAADQELGRNATTEMAKTEHLLLVPLGSTEQHGPHLPLATDSIIATAWAEALAAKNPGAVVAPLLPYGSAGEHQAFAGTLSIGEAALTFLLVELARSAKHTFDRVVFVSGHAGNASALAKVVAQLRAEDHDVAALVPIIPGADLHAGLAETSLLLHVAPDLVNMAVAEAGNLQPLSELLVRLRQEGVIGVSPSGVLGNPLGATAEHGAELLEVLAAVSIYDGGHC